MAVSDYVLRKRQTFFLKDRHIPAVYWEGKTPWCMVYMQHKGPRMKYLCGQLPAHYPVPTTIGYEITDSAIYVSDTRYYMDGMPLFRGYTWQEWTKGWE